MTSTNTEELKMARIGPMREIATECFAPPSNDDKKAEAETQQQKKKINLPLKLVAQLRNILVSDHERQNVLTYTVESYSTEVRLEYMRFTEDIKIDHCWLGLLSWWNHQSHDKEVAYNTIFEEKTRIEAFNGVEKVIGVARVYEPTRGDTETVSNIMKEHMTAPYRYQFEYYLRKYNIPKCLRILKLWLWDVQEGRQKAPDTTEDADMRMHRVKQLLTVTHNYDGVSKFPRLARKSRRITDIDMMMAVHNDAVRKRCYQQQSPPPPPKRRSTNVGYAATKIKKIELSSDDDASDTETTTNKNGEEKAEGPMPPMYEPVTPPHPPPPPPQDDSDDDGSRPPRVSRPRPTDPQLNRHQ